MADVSLDAVEAHIRQCEQYLEDDVAAASASAPTAAAAAAEAPRRLMGASARLGLGSSTVAQPLRARPAVTTRYAAAAAADDSHVLNRTAPLAFVAPAGVQPLPPTAAPAHVAAPVLSYLPTASMSAVPQPQQPLFTAPYPTPQSTAPSGSAAVAGAGQPPPPSAPSASGLALSAAEREALVQRLLDEHHRRTGRTANGTATQSTAATPATPTAAQAPAPSRAATQQRPQQKRASLGSASADRSQRPKPKAHANGKATPNGTAKPTAPATNGSGGAAAATSKPAPGAAPGRLAAAALRNNFVAEPDPTASGTASADSSGSAKGAAWTGPRPDRVRQWDEEYSAAMARRAELKREADAKRLADCTFQPKVSATARAKPKAKAKSQSQSQSQSQRPAPQQQRSSNGGGGGGGSDEAVGQLFGDPDIFDASEVLAADAAAATRPAAAAGQPTDAEVDAPAAADTGAEPFASASASASAMAAALIDRLYEPANVRVQQRAELKRAREEDELKQHSFQPEINFASRQRVTAGATGYRPPHTRVGDDQKRRVTLITALAAQRDAEASRELTFTPQINPLSAAIAQRTRRDTDATALVATPTGADPATAAATALVPAASASTARDTVTAVTERLAGGGARLVEAKLARDQKLKAERDAQLTFQPRINPTSAAIVARLQHPAHAVSANPQAVAVAPRGAPLDVVERQAVYDELRRSAHAVRRHEIESEADRCTFRPDIGNAERVLANARFHHHSDALSETPAQRVQRMSVGQLKAQEQLRERLAAERDAELPFQPALNSTSRALARRRTLSDLQRESASVAVGAVSASRHALQRAAEDQFRAEHTFRPQLATAHTHIAVAVPRQPAPHTTVARPSASVAASSGEPISGTTGGGSGGSAASAAASTSAPAAPTALAVSIEPAVVVDGAVIRNSRYKLIDPRNPNALQANVQRLQKERDARLAAAQKQKADAELRDCTFSPRTAIERERAATGAVTVAQPRGPVAVAGLQQFLDRKAAAAKLEREKRERAAQQFERHRSYRGDVQPFTVPQPFRLATAAIDRTAAGQRRADRTARAAQAAAAELTFQPKTNARDSRELLRLILDADTDADPYDVAAQQRLRDVDAADFDAADGVSGAADVDVDVSGLEAFLAQPQS